MDVAPAPDEAPTPTKSRARRGTRRGSPGAAPAAAGYYGVLAAMDPGSPPSSSSSSSNASSNAGGEGLGHDSDATSTAGSGRSVVSAPAVAALAQAGGRALANPMAAMANRRQKTLAFVSIIVLCVSLTVHWTIVPSAGPVSPPTQVPSVVHVQSPADSLLSESAQWEEDEAVQWTDSEVLTAYFVYLLAARGD